MDLQRSNGNQTSQMRGKGVAVIVPCLNESLTIGKVIKDFQYVLPEAELYVYDNGSGDGTAEAALAAGAIVRYVGRRGKGAVLRRAFADVEADYYIIIDGDDTYPAAAAPAMLKLAQEGADMVCGDRLTLDSYKRRERENLHNFGNRAIGIIISLLLGVKVKDVLTGYRVLSRRFVKNCPILLDGFEVETEMTIHAVGHKFDLVEYAIAYGHRPEGSHSKIKTFQDGILILRTIVWLGKDTKPLRFFGLASLTFFLMGAGLWYCSVSPAYTGFCIIVGTTLAACGMILDTVTKQHLQDIAVKRLQG
jgi:glycosyltransferase involved in cell wall biosynthesis